MPLFGKNEDGSKKKFSETRVALFLKEKAPEIVATIGDILPEKGGLGMLKNLITKNSKLSPEDKLQALELLEMDLAFEKEITERWKADMASDSWLSKNARPLVLLSMVAFMFICVILDSFFDVHFEVSDLWIDTIKYVLMASVTAYFGVRGVEKAAQILKGKKV